MPPGDIVLKKISLEIILLLHKQNIYLRSEWRCSPSDAIIMQLVWCNRRLHREKHLLSDHSSVWGAQHHSCSCFQRTTRQSLVTPCLLAKQEHRPASPSTEDNGLCFSNYRWLTDKLHEQHSAATLERMMAFRQSAREKVAFPNCSHAWQTSSGQKKHSLYHTKLPLRSSWLAASNGWVPVERIMVNSNFSAPWQVRSTKCLLLARELQRPCWYSLDDMTTVASKKGSQSRTCDLHGTGSHPTAPLHFNHSHCIPGKHPLTWQLSEVALHKGLSLLHS